MPVEHDDVFAADGAFIYVVDKKDWGNRYSSDRGLSIISIENTGAPRLVRRVLLSNYYPALDVACFGRFVYLSVQYEALQVIDTAPDAANKPPKSLRELQLGYTNMLVRDGDTLYVGSNGGPYLLRLSETGNGVPSAYGTPPSPQTLGYMKRRAKRYLHDLAKNSPRSIPKWRLAF